MSFLRVHIKGLTASFRYPAFISGFQPTLPVPPISTIYGLISAAKGDIVTPEDVSIGYVFESKGEGEDLEKVYELQKARKAKTNILKREFLFEPELHLYLDDPSFADYFKRPFYPLLMGRSSDLVKVKDISEVELSEDKGVKLGRTILPFGTEGAHGVFQSLPTHFSNTIPREARGVKPFILMDEFFEYENNCQYDPEMNWGVWIH